MNITYLNLQHPDQVHSKFLMPVFLYGESIFTSSRIIQGGVPWWEEHKKRLIKGVKSFFFMDNSIRLSKLKSDFDYLEKELDKGLEQIKNIENGYLRITVFPNHQMGLGEVVNTVEELGVIFQFSDEVKYGKNKKCCTLDLGNLNFPSYIKSSSYANQVYWKRFIADKELDDYIRLSGRKVMEASTSNVFLYMGQNQFITSKIEPGILSGITRAKLIEYLIKNHYQCHEVEMNLDDLECAEEIFLTNAVQGICPVAQLNGKIYKTEIAKSLQAKWPWGIHE